MTVEDLTKHYVKAFKKGPLSSETRKAYDNLKQYGDSLGVNLSKTFFQNLLEQCRREPQKYQDKTVDEINKDILSQCMSYMQQMQEKTGKSETQTSSAPKPERRNVIEIL